MTTKLIVPDHLEDLILVQGPSAFALLIELAGGKTSAAREAGVSNSTVSRWSSASPGAMFGQRKDVRLKSYRSMWWGYPPPIPALDRVTEEIYGDEASFVRQCVERGVWGTVRDRGRLGLAALGASATRVRKACESVGIPRTTRERLEAGVRYPQQWDRLDRLVTALTDEAGWIEFVIQSSSSEVRQIGPSALGAMIAELDLRKEG